MRLWVRNQREVVDPSVGLSGILVVLALCAGVGAQTPAKKNIFDDDFSPPPMGPNVPRPQGEPPQVTAPAPGLVPGLIVAVHEGNTIETPERQHLISPRSGIGFDAPALSDFLPNSFSFRGSINIPAGGALGTFHVDTAGEYDVTIDGQLVTTLRTGDPVHTYEHQVNLAPGLHAISAGFFHLKGIGTRGHANLLWQPLAGTAQQLSPAWCWHAKADEPADATPLPAAPSRNSTPSGGAAQGWIAAGTPRPPEAAAPNDLLPWAVLEYYNGPALQQLARFTLIPAAGFTININQPRPTPTSFHNGSFQLCGTLKFDREGQYTFDCQVPAEIALSIDGRVVTHGLPGQPTTRDAVALRPGIHAFQLAISNVVADMGIYRTGISWSMNNAPFVPVPNFAVGHYRSQERYADSVAGGGAGNAAPAPPVPAPIPAPRIVRLPIPDPDAQAKVSADLRQRYPTGWADPGTAQQADFLIRAADQSRDDAVASYVLLQKAAAQAQAAAAASLAFRAIDLLASQFAVDAPRLKVTVLQALGSRRLADPSSRAALLEAYNQAMAADNYAAACDVANMALADARVQNLPAEIAAATNRLNGATAASAELEKVKPMLARLADNPNDTAANLAAARFYCFTAKNWERGIPALARSNDPALSWLGRHESMASQGPQEQVTLANGWWDAADGQPAASAAVMRERAAQWYNLAAPNLVGLSRRVAQRRVALVPAAAALPSPLISPAPPAIANGTVPAPASGGFAPPPSPNPGIDVQPPAGVRPRMPQYTGPLVVVIDHAALISPWRCFAVLSTIDLQVRLMTPDAAVTVLIADTPPVTVNFVAGDFAAKPELKKRIETALNTAAAASDFDAGIRQGLANHPLRLEILSDAHISLERVAAILNELDPNRAVHRGVRIWFPEEEKELGHQKFTAARAVIGGRISVSSAPDPKGR